MTEADIAALPVPYRLALSYAPAAARPAAMALLRLDDRLSRIVAGASEPLIAQIKLAWWRDQFAKPPPDWPRGEPLLAELRACGFEGSDLGALVDGWEAAGLAETVQDADVDSLADGRARAWSASALAPLSQGSRDAVAHAAHAWTAGECERHAAPETTAAPLPRSHRSLAVLAALGRRASQRRQPMLDGPAALALAMRVGIFGR